MTSTRTPLGRLAFALLLAALGVACSPTALPLPMLSAGHGPAHHAPHPGGR